MGVFEKQGDGPARVAILQMGKLGQVRAELSEHFERDVFAMRQLEQSINGAEVFNAALKWIHHYR